MTSPIHLPPSPFQVHPLSTWSLSFPSALSGTKLRIPTWLQWREDFSKDGSEYSNIVKRLWLPSGLPPGNIVHHLSPVVWCPRVGYENNHQLSKPFRCLYDSRVVASSSITTATWIYWGATVGTRRVLMKQGVPAESQIMSRYVSRTTGLRIPAIRVLLELIWGTFHLGAKRGGKTPGERSKRRQILGLVSALMPDLMSILKS